MAKKKQSAEAAACGCEVCDTGGAGGEGDNGRHAAGVDPEIKASNLARLKRIEGQVRGLHKMVENDRYCADILTQLSAVHEALRGVGRELMRNHLRHCVAAATRAGGDEAQQTYDELINLMYKSAR